MMPGGGGNVLTGGEAGDGGGAAMQSERIGPASPSTAVLRGTGIGELGGDSEESI